MTTTNSPEPRKWLSDYLCLLSAIAACVLLLNPAAFWSRLRSLLPGLEGVPISDAYRRHHALCKRADCLSGCPLQDQKGECFRGCLLNPLLSEGTPAPTVEEPDLPDVRRNSQGFTLEENWDIESYRAATAEIRDRISHEQVLSVFKFSIVGGILWVLFHLLKIPLDYQGTFLRQRRTALFFSAALLTCTIVDYSLRFNMKLVETLGDWIWCLEESRKLHLGWEHFLPAELESNWFPIMRRVSLLFTALLYSVILYIFVILPNDKDNLDEGTSKVVKAAAAAMFALLVVFGSSYDGFSRPTIRVLVSVVLALVGYGSLLFAFRVRLKGLARRADLLSPAGDTADVPDGPLL